jgi:hypothetical protein
VHALSPRHLRALTGWSIIMTLSGALTEVSDLRLGTWADRAAVAVLDRGLVAAPLHPGYRLCITTRYGASS